MDPLFYTQKLAQHVRQSGWPDNYLKNMNAMNVNVSSPAMIKVRGQDIPYVDKSTYLGSVLCEDGSTILFGNTTHAEKSKKYLHGLKWGGQQATALR